ncbi:ribose-phosphate diphosphokinase [Sulfurihydrogenibium azorense]|uniref:Ribose-phosphate pyrophosphokinase n=1 Tax=Sulfurihydrogenibium azorense (strain DSM 15241 / OCM 825 / Az-Fu1) TaxID=204536 RepID=C1DXV2_SULAA|nr:ribose-phosphate pyrophosphokinase [Sulfurihydrogenibium azorense]ACN99298.1 ribose-Phosphate pyrophosphokinase [Sulfurihydrogenibium azorense Az-Fu1]MDM7273479.1 ribose-phosphate pyrophosphokinase [Sulfurihydrogenibium azorense]
MSKVLKLISGNANKSLAKEISDYLETPLVDVLLTKFSDGEIRVQINENVRGADVFVIQSLTHPVNDHIMELLLLLDALKRSSTHRITAVIPYFAYARQDRKDKPRVPISAKLLADIIQKAGADRVLTVDLHSAQIQGFFDCPVDNIYALPVIYEYLKAKNIEDLVIVSPDAGGVERARMLQNRLGGNLAIIYKKRPAPNVVETLDVIGNVEGKNAVIIDDIIDTAGTIVAAADMLKSKGAKSVIAACTHPVFSGPAIERLKNSAIEEVIATNTIPLEGKEFDKLTVLSVAELIGEAIKRINIESSVSSLFI